MTTLVRATALLLLTTPAALHAQQAQGGWRPAFVVRDSMLIPEGIAHDPHDGSFYLSSTHQRKIVRIDSAGVAADFSRDARLRGVVGMSVDTVRRILWAASAHAGDGMPMQRPEQLAEGTSALHAFDLRTGALLQVIEHSAADGTFLNDVAVLHDGSALVTDSRTRRIYRARIGSHALEEYASVAELGSPNGIAVSPDGRHVFLALWSASPGIARIDTHDHSVHLLELAAGVEISGIDGLYWSDGGLIAVEPWREAHKVTRFQLDTDRRRITAATAVGGLHPAFDQPTTGVLARGSFHVIANSHLQTFARALRAGTAPALRPVVILRTPLPATSASSSSTHSRN